MAQLTRAEVERRGRQRQFVRAGLLGLALFVVQLPLWSAVERWSPASGQSFVSGCVVPIRLSLLVDLAFLGVALTFAFRTLQLVRVEAPLYSRLRRLAAVAFGVLALVVAMDLVEDWLLWDRATEAASTCPAMGVTLDAGGVSVPYTLVLRALFAAALAVLLVVRLIAFLGHRRDDPGMVGRDVVLSSTGPAPVRTRTTGGTRNGAASTSGTVIACSGGGIRSASFSLGALQQLTSQGIYQSAKAVVGVSGGGYMAASYHVLRAKSPSDGDLPPYAQTSPEMTRLRRQTNYLLASPWVATQGVLSLLFGMAVNLALVLVFLRLGAWMLGWLFSEYDVVRGLDTATSSVSFADEPVWISGVWVVSVAGVGLFVLAKLADRLATAGFMASRRLTKVTALLIWGGVAVSAVLLGVPLAISGLHNLATSNEPTPAIAGLLHSLGFATTAACESAAIDACGVTGTVTDATRSDSATSVGLVAIVLAILAVVRAAQASVQDEAGETTWFGKRVRRAWKVTRDVVLPWLATMVIGLSFLVVFLRWTADLTRSEDLRSQWGVAALCVGILVMTKLATDANRTSLHYFYRERLSQAYLVRRRSEIAEPLAYREPVRFSETPATDGGPDLIMCAAANVHDTDFIPAERNCTPFVFDRSSIGLTDLTLPGGTSLPQARLYEHRADARYRDATIPAAMAISGAAFSPLTGRQSVRSRPYRFVLALANARLGVWLPNPYWIDEACVAERLVWLGRKREAYKAVRRLSADDVEALRFRLGVEHQHWVDDVLSVQDDGTDELPVPHLPNVSALPLWLRKLGWDLRSILDKPGPFRLMKEAFGKSSVFDRKLYITDGGHYDNLGLVEALRRRPAEIFVLDASSDPEDSFRALGEAIATARMDLGVEVRFDPRGMRRLGDGRAQAAWGKGTATYPDGARAVVYVAKVVLTDGMPWDVETYASANPTFPRTSTGDQLYNEWDLEAYRVLGREVTRMLLRNEWVPPTTVPRVPFTPAESRDRHDDVEPAAPIRQTVAGAAASEGWVG